MNWESLKSQVRQKTHICLKDNKRDSVNHYLALKYPGVKLEEAYVKISASVVFPEDFISLITINETYFFRHPQQIEDLENHFTKNTLVPYKILSVGCSSGEEPYSVAMSLQSKSINCSVTGVDIDQQMINTAKKGFYNTDEINRSEQKYKNLILSFMDIFHKNSSVLYAVKQSIKSRVAFQCGNIFHMDFTDLDAIFCRNILIYFDESDRIKLIKNLCHFLKKDGLLILGAGELKPQAAFNSLENINGNSYKKVA